MTISASDANEMIIELDRRRVDHNSGEVWKKFNFKASYT